MGLRPCVSPCCIGKAEVDGVGVTPRKKKMGPLNRIVDHVSSKLAFFPPRPSTYQVAEHQDGSHELYIQPLLQCAPRPL